MPVLVLLRHAKAEPQRPDDRSRRITQRGVAQCLEVRDWLLQHELRPERVVVSPSARTQETWEHAAPEPCDAVPEDRVYDASPETLRDVVAETPPGVATLVVVGHNPGIERLAWELDDSPVARAGTGAGLGTSGVAAFELDGWDAPYGRLIACRPTSLA